VKISFAKLLPPNVEAELPGGFREALFDEDQQPDRQTLWFGRGITRSAPAVVRRIVLITE